MLIQLLSFHMISSGHRLPILGVDYTLIDDRIEIFCEAVQSLHSHSENNHPKYGQNNHYDARMKHNSTSPDYIQSFLLFVLFLQYSIQNGIVSKMCAWNVIQL